MRFKAMLLPTSKLPNQPLIIGSPGDSLSGRRGLVFTFAEHKLFQQKISKISSQGK